MSPGERWDRRAPARLKDSPTRAGARGTQGSQGSQSSQSSQSSQGNAKDRRSVEYGWRSGGYLPHFDAPRAIQHIIYRLADSLPKEAVERLEFELKALPAENKPSNAAGVSKGFSMRDSARAFCSARNLPESSLKPGYVLTRNAIDSLLLSSCQIIATFSSSV